MPLTYVRGTAYPRTTQAYRGPRLQAWVNASVANAKRMYSATGLPVGIYMMEKVMARERFKVKE